MTIEVRRGELNALYGFAERQLHVVKRYWVWEVVWLFYSLVSVLSIGFLASGLGSLGANNASFDLARAQLYLLIGSLLWGYLSLVFMEAAFAIAWERWEGTIEYTFMAPIRRVTHLMGMSIFTSVLPMVSPQKGEQMSIALQGFLLLVSGVYYPLTVLPVPLQLAGYASPLTYALDGIRRSLLDGATMLDVLPAITVLIAMGLVMIPAAIWVFGWAEKRAKRLGLLKRSG
jgi:ABC-2 type transport system permease protein